MAFISTLSLINISLLSHEVLGRSLQGEFGKFLRGRKDTVRVVVSSLLNEDEEGGLDLKGGKVGEENEDDEGKEKKGGVEEGKEVLNLLVGVFGSKDKFIAEYRSLLSAKLSTNRTFDADGEIRKLELLKLRFGESCLRECEIMIRDLEESRRIWNNYKGESTNTANAVDGQPTGGEGEEEFTALVLSSVFWPNLGKGTFNLHPSLEVHKTRYNASFKRLKKPRELVWYDTLGKVDVEVEVIGEDGELEIRDFSVTTMLATVIMHFGDKGRWTVTELANEMAIDVQQVKRRLGFWGGKGVVVEEERGVWRGVEKGDRVGEGKGKDRTVCTGP